MEQICSQVHFVAPEIDAGAIILQAPVPVEVDDTVETLRERVKKVRCVVKNVDLYFFFILLFKIKTFTNDC